MNYRHAYHAGNFADVLKHAVACRIQAYMAAKAKPLLVLDTHAGAGAYDLTGPEADRTGEYRDGIARLLDLDPVPPLLDPYLERVRRLGGARNGALPAYPGSPWLLADGLRDGDRLVACELEPTAHQDLAHLMRRRANQPGTVKVRADDGWAALTSFLPPPERRALVLVDPPYEAADDFPRLAERFLKAHRRFPTGVFVLWYPVKQRSRVDALHATLRNSDPKNLLIAELGLYPGESDSRLNGCGLVIANPPYTLADELTETLPLLNTRLTKTTTGTHHLITL
ncbi:23S rRNA (adenine(2030)-N(6))-methyltransferase RlmJ [Roseospirillum parvum]|uniref:Ribosomal RNA large subunit methyltransferase J n=1 Tax=Roseospirillum parvum TaxID=83401 RepID=A0A1G8FP54_9PROT|nr:23S rRNA (adenine(2030)-N(6))-methyltransferase RlmJ [Roseospirillum parvum]SDH83963.1 23S rRNA (adenine2030-N6)-methyltransferase [Roseospirillum parvum]